MLVRRNQHVAWRGYEEPNDLGDLIDLVRGHHTVRYKPPRSRSKTILLLWLHQATSCMVRYYSFAPSLRQIETWLITQGCRGRIWSHMPLKLEDYALIGDCESAALVGRDGSIDWLCWPRFDSDACFAALLGNPSHGRWLLAPVGEPVRISRRYREDTLILETRFESETGAVDPDRLHAIERRLLQPCAPFNR